MYVQAIPIHRTGTANNMPKAAEMLRSNSDEKIIVLRNMYQIPRPVKRVVKSKNL